MYQEDYYAFRKGKLTAVRALEGMITNVARGVFAYMVMLTNLGRGEESKFLECIRTKVFDIRAKIGDDTTQEGLDELANDMKGIYYELNTAYLFLRAHKPDEAIILQSVTNDACGLIYVIKHFKDPV